MAVVAKQIGNKKGLFKKGIISDFINKARV
jgi:hypothetical protein